MTASKAQVADAAPGRLALGTMRTTASHTIGIPHLVELLRAVPPEAPAEAYKVAAVDENVLGRPTLAGRKRTFRHLRELYVLDPSDSLFNVFRYLWDIDANARSLLAGIQAFTRDEVLRASWSAIETAQPGEVVSSADLADSVALAFGDQMSVTTLGKCGRNTGACWTQTGHLAGRTNKTRQVVVASPTTTAFVAYLGYLFGRRGLDVLDTPWAELLDVDPTPSARLAALTAAHQHGLLNLQVAGSIIAITFPLLTAHSSTTASESHSGRAVK